MKNKELAKGTLLLFLCTLSLYAFSQGQTNSGVSTTSPIPNYAPPSPEAAALGKFGDIPVGLSTGVPNITIPIYQIKLKGLTVPISISYHSSGVKVDELATNVGLDWVLDAGGVINQTVYGLNDQAGWLDAAAGRTPQTGLLQTSWSIDPAHPVAYSGTPEYSFNKNSAMGYLDTQPDLFSYSFPGNSGKFFFDQDQGVHLMPYKNLKIETNINNHIISSYVITDESGNKFYFSDVEVTITNSADCSGSVTGSSTDFNKSFYLTKIVTPNNEEADFHYEAKGYTMQNQIMETRYWASTSPVPGEYLPDPLPNCITTSNSTVGGIRLVEIDNITSGDKVSFSYGTTDRLDLPGTNSLDQMKIFNSKNSLIHQFDLSHDYFVSNDGGSAPLNYRLKLTGIQEQGKQPYYFEYNTTPLPSRLSFAQDFWGYYNGQGNNTTMLPNEHSPFFDTGANRDPDITYTQAGILTKITYPTGGFSSFEYENNDSYVTENQGSYVDNFANALAHANQTTTVTFTVAENSMDFRAQWVSNSSNSGDNGTFNPDGDNTFITLTGPTGGAFNGSLGFTANSNGIEKLLNASQEQQPLGAGTYTITITNTNGSGTPPSEYLNIWWKTAILTSVPHNQVAGGLRVKAISEHSATAPTVTHHYEYVSASTAGISSGVLMNPVQYDYDYLHSKHVSTAIGNVIIKYIAQNSTSQVPLGTFQGLNVIYANVNVYDNDKNGGYTSNEFTTNGRSMIRFSAPSVPAFPFEPVQTIDWLDGLPVKTTAYKYNSLASSFFPLSIKQQFYKTMIGSPTSNFYDADPANEHEYYVRGVKIAYTGPPDILDNAASLGISVTSGSGILPDQFAVGYYYLYSSWSHLDQEVTTQYDQNGQNPVVNTVNYYYDNPNHTQLTRTVTTRSDGKVITSLTTYPDDYSSGTTFLDDMRTNHLVGMPVEKVNYLADNTGTKVLGGQVSQYQSGGKGLLDKVFKLETSAPVALSAFKFSGTATGSLPSPSAISSYSLDSRYNEKLTYNQYDNVGNPLMLTPKNGSPVSYQWCYNKQYPIAECKNAANTEFFYEGFEESTASGLQTNGGHTGHNYINGNYTVAWTPPSGNTRSYVISYWYKNSSTGLWAFQTEQAYTAGMTLSNGTAYDDIRVYPKDAQMTTYTYEPLVGMTSSTDAKGQTTYYEYDIFQRLTNVKDQDGNILKHTDYHYQNQ